MRLAEKKVIVTLPTDQASTALFLATEESSWMTGQILTVDGGHSISLSITKNS